MLSVQKLRVKIDSLEQKITGKLDKLETHTHQYISIYKVDSMLVDPRKKPDGDSLISDTTSKKVDGRKRLFGIVQQKN